MTTRKNISPNKISTGFTLLELTIYLAISLILCSVVAYKWCFLLSRSTADSIAHQIISTLQLVRSEAIRLNKPEKICVNPHVLIKDGHVMLDVSHQYELVWQGNFGATNCITFLPCGRTFGQRGSVLLTHHQQTLARVVLIDSGRVRIE